MTRPTVGLGTRLVLDEFVECEVLHGMGAWNGTSMGWDGAGREREGHGIGEAKRGDGRAAGQRGIGEAKRGEAERWRLGMGETNRKKRKSGRAKRGEGRVTGQRGGKEERPGNGGEGWRKR
eukprot:361622-Chlamydomonas_euryale.AAC.1